MSDLLPTVDVGGPQYSPAVPAGQQGSEFAIRQQVRSRLRNLGYPAPAVEGILQNLDRESGFNPEAVGDGGTSLGLMQAHKSRKDDLLRFAEEQKKPVSDPDLQVDFIDHELKTKFPALRQSLMNAKDAGTAEEQFKRIYERPASVMWSRGASGEPILGNEDFRFSPDSFRGDVMMMPPQDYLDLAEGMDAPNARKRKSLAQSLAAGEPIEDLPSLDVQHEAGSPTGTVSASDGRHRALAAQEAGLPSIPVAVNGAQPGMTELTGQQGKTLPVNYHRPTSFMDLLIPRAEAAQPTGTNIFQDLIPKEKPQGNIFQDLIPQQQVTPAPPMYMGEAGAQAETAEIARGIAEPVLGAVELAGKGLEKIGIPTGMADWANRQVQNVEQATQPAIAAAPGAASLGGLELAIPEMLAGGAAGGALFGTTGAVPGIANMLRTIGMGGLRAIPGGVASSLVQPARDLENYWSEKLDDALKYGGINALVGSAVSGIARVAAPLAQRVSERRDRQDIGKQVTNVIQTDIQPVWQRMMQTPISLGQVRNLQGYIQTPIGQTAIRQQITKLANRSSQGFNPATLGLVQNAQRQWIIDPTVAGTKNGTAPAMWFIDAVRSGYDDEIRKAQDAVRKNPRVMPDLAALLQQRAEIVHLTDLAVPGYRNMVERMEAGTELLAALAETPEQVHRLLHTSWSAIRGLGNIMFHNAPHAAANFLQAADAARNARVSRANRLASFAQARDVLPSMPPVPPNKLNALSQLGQQAGMGAATVVPGL